MRMSVLMAVLGWMFLVAANWLQIPLHREMGWFGALFVVAFGWMWGGLWTFIAVLLRLSVRAYARAVVVLVVAAVVGAGVWVVDWRAVFVDGVVWAGRDAFGELAADYRGGRPVEAPRWMAYVSVGGEVRVLDRGLYLPVLVDEWRGESGAGIAYLGLSPSAGRLVPTAEGGMGRPVRDLGDGWWWVE
ncbi:hypothetical protein ACWEPN_43595 [Nonomuraea wenchangensis]